MAIESNDTAGANEGMAVGDVVQDAVGVFYVQTEDGPVEVSEAVARAIDAISKGDRLLIIALNVPMDSPDPQPIYPVPSGRKVLTTRVIIADPTDDTTDGSYRFEFESGTGDVLSSVPGPPVGKYSPANVDAALYGSSAQIGPSSRSDTLYMVASSPSASAGATATVFYFGVLL